MTTEKTEKVDELYLEVRARALHGWDRIRITRGIERMPSDFDISIMEYYPGGEQQWVSPGDPCIVKLGEDIVITGYVDRCCSSIRTNQHQIRVTGRGKCQDLVDCSAEWESNVMTGLDALGMSQRLAAPYDIHVTTDVTGLQAAPQLTINWGESPQEIIDRVCRWSALLAYDLPDGNL